MWISAANSYSTGSLSYADNGFYLGAFSLGEWSGMHHVSDLRILQRDLTDSWGKILRQLFMVADVKFS